MEDHLAGGLGPELEFFTLSRPDTPEMRDSATLWIMDDSGELAFPRVTLDAIAGHWDEPWAQLNMVLRDGRAARLWRKLPGCAAADQRSAGPLEFKCLEPFRRWSMSFEGEVEVSTTDRQLTGEARGQPARLSFLFEAEMAAPPWLMGGMTAEAANAMDANGGALMGGVRYEQLCRIAGWAKLGDETWRVSGTGMRVRRRGVRNMSGAPGHCQHSALFPSGRGFGANVFWPAVDGSFPFNEAFVLSETGERLPARLTEAPWMTRLSPAGDEVPLVFDTPRGKLRIEGRTLLKTFDHHNFEMADTSVLEQGAARYVWEDGEETIGLFERCTLRERIGNLDGEA